MLDQERLISELRSALAHLGDPPYLEDHPLAGRISNLGPPPGLSRGQALRRTLRLAIAALDPGASNASSVLQARAYQCLYRFAISRESMQAIASEQGISRRQAYRELRRGITALAQILSDLIAISNGEKPSVNMQAAVHAGRLREELERLSTERLEEFDLTQLVTGAIATAQHLADH